MKGWLALCLAILLAGCSPAELQWQGYGGDGRRSLTAPEPGPGRGRLLWVAELDQAGGSPVVDAEGMIYVPHGTGGVSKFNRQGKLVWQVDSWLSQAGPSPHLTVLSGKRLLLSVLSPEHHSICLDPGGAVLPGEWLPWPATQSPAVNMQGYAVMCHQYAAGPDTVGLRIFALNREGELLWSREYLEARRVWSGSLPVVSEDGTAYVFIEGGNEHNALVAFDSRGRELWQRTFATVEAAGVGIALAAHADKTVYIGTSRVEDIGQLYNPGRVLAVDRQGNLLWQADAGQRVVQLLVGHDRVVANVLRTKLLALDRQGEVLWEHRMEGWESNAVMDSRGRIYLAGAWLGTARAKAVDARGREMWELDTGQEAASVSFVALSDGILFFATDTGKLLAVGR